MDGDARRARFAQLHTRGELFVMPNPWDVGSARLLASMGFDALATTSAGFAWSLGRLDQQVTRNELIDHVATMSAATDLPLNADSERCYPDEDGGVAETVRLLADAGAAGFSIEDFDPVTGQIDDVGFASEQVAVAAEANRALSTPMVLTGRAENHIRGVQDLDDTIARLIAYRDAGADAVYAPGLTTIEQITQVLDALRCPVNVLALPGGAPIAELAAAGVRRVSTGSLLASRSYGALLAGAEALRDGRDSTYAEGGAGGDVLRDAFRS